MPHSELLLTEQHETLHSDVVHAQMHDGVAVCVELHLDGHGGQQAKFATHTVVHTNKCDTGSAHFLSLFMHCARQRTA
jgi:hypothetical protein